jgi:hypothetical protein
LWIYLGEQLQIRIVKSTVVGSKEQGQLKRKVYNAQLCRLHESRSLKVLEQHRHWSKEGTAARQEKTFSQGVHDLLLLLLLLLLKLLTWKSGLP